MWIQILLSLVLWEIGSSIDVNDCPDSLSRDKYLTAYGDKCYYFYKNVKQEYNEAQKICISKGGNLASVKNGETNSFIWQELNFEYNFDHDSLVWIGLTDQEKEGDYIWRDGSKMEYNNFASGTGSNTSSIDLSNRYQDCVAMKVSDGKWTDIRCSDLLPFVDVHKKAFVCEYNRKPSSGHNNTNTNPPTSHSATIENCPKSVHRTKYLKVLDNTCYYFYLSKKLEFAGAQYLCEIRGGNLVSISSQKVNNFLWKELEQTFKFGDEVWIGLTDKDEGTFVWTDGSPTDYENFGFGKGPNSFLYSEDCVTLDPKDGKWKDQPCTAGVLSIGHRPFICQFPAILSTTPSPQASETTSTEPVS